MPELPEVETVRRGLDVHLVGRRIERVEVGRERTVRRTSRQAVIDGLTGTTIVETRRRGKYLLLGLDSGDDVMIQHVSKGICHESHARLAVAPGLRAAHRDAGAERAG